MSEELETGVEEIPAAGEQEELNEGDQVPVSVVKAIREEQKLLKAQLAAEKEERTRMADEMAIYRAQLRQGAAAPPKTDDPFSDLDDDDVLTVSQLKGIVTKLSARNQGAVAEMSVRQRKNDYEEVITKHLPNVLKNDPHLADLIRSSSNPYLLAYELGQKDPDYLASKARTKGKEAADRAAENAKKPGSLSTARGSGNVRGGEYYAKLSREDFEKKIAEVKRAK